MLRWIALLTTASCGFGAASDLPSSGTISWTTTGPDRPPVKGGIVLKALKETLFSDGAGRSVVLKVFEGDRHLTTSLRPGPDLQIDSGSQTVFVQPEGSLALPLQHKWFGVRLPESFLLGNGFEMYTKIDGRYKLDASTTLEVIRGQSAWPYPTKLIRRDARGVALTEWVLGEPIDAGPGIRIPGKAVMRSANGEVHTVTILQAELGKKPSDAVLNPAWYRKGYGVMDRRVEPATYWSWEELRDAFKSKEPTLEALLAMSEERARNMAADSTNRQVNATTSANKARSPITAFFLVLVCSAFILGGFVVITHFWSVKHQN